MQERQLSYFVMHIFPGAEIPEKGRKEIIKEMKERDRE